MRRCLFSSSAFIVPLVNKILISVCVDFYVAMLYNKKSMYFRREGEFLSSYYEKKKKGGMKFRFSFIILFTVASFAACFALYMNSDEEPTLPSDDFVSPVTEAASETEVSETAAEKKSTADVNPVSEGLKLDKQYFDSCMFAGDSLVVGLGTYGIIPEERIAAGIGMNVMSINEKPLVNADGSEIMAADKINSNAPENLYILLGLNMLGSYTEEQLLAAYGDFVDSISDDVQKIYVISVPPVTAARESSEENPIMNTDIDSFNSELLKFANNRCLYYVDVNSSLKGSDGRLPEEYAEADGIHFKKSTYDIMLDYLLTHVYMG